MAWSAGRTEPLRAMRPDLQAQKRAARGGGGFGIALLVLGALALAVRPFVPEGDGAIPALVGSTGGLMVGLGLLLGIQHLLPALLWLLAFPLRHTIEGPVAVRSLVRHRRRSANSVGAMGIGLILVVAAFTMGSSLLGRWHKDLREQHPSDIRVEVPWFYQRGVAVDLIGELSRIPGVTTVAAVGENATVVITGWDWSRANPEWMAAVSVGSNRFWKGYQALGVQWADLPALVAMGAYKIREGSLDSWGESSIAFTQNQAKLLGVKAGERLEINISQERLFEERAANPVVRTYTVAAILEDGSFKLPRSVIAAPLPGSPTSLRAVYANASPDQRAEARAAAQGLLKQMAYNIAEYSDFEGATRALRAQTNQRLALLLAVAGVMAAVAAMSLVNTMVSSVSERRREFALLRSVGATPGQVERQVLLEAVLLGLVGGIVGVVGGAVLGAGGVGLELPWEQVRFPWAAMGAGLLLSAGIACLAALGPARQVARLSPAEAVRAE